MTDSVFWHSGALQIGLLLLLLLSFSLSVQAEHLSLYHKCYTYDDSYCNSFSFYLLLLLLLLLLPRNAIFPDEPGPASSNLGPPLVKSVPEQNLWISRTGVLWARCPSCHPTVSVKALQGTQNTNPNQWPGLILSSSTTRFLTALLPLRWLSDVSFYLAGQFLVVTTG